MSASDSSPRSSNKEPHSGAGERWGCPSRGIDPLVEVEVIRHGAQKPARVLIRFVDASFDGREEWGPPARLKVFCSGSVEFEAREARWDRMDTHPGLREQPTEYAVDTVFARIREIEAEKLQMEAELTTVADDLSEGAIYIRG